MTTKSIIHWPHRYNLMGVAVSATSYQETVEKLFEAAQQSVPAIASFHAAHAVVCASSDKKLQERVNSFNIVAPDGQPVRWALNALYNTSMRYRVDGPETMRHVCERAAFEQVPIYLFGGASQEVLDKLIAELERRFAGILIAGAESPPFRPLTSAEDAAVVERINASGAKFVFIGLGSPKQEHFAYEHRERIKAVQLCVGAAFDFHAGTIKRAPKWMQRNGLEWLYRACSEPRRLGKRYLTTNSIFVYKFARQCFSQKIWARKPRTTAPRV
jgi:N-acetylglucosaminyldiphosphoundecaprenol N-acetyl-beta-D-mannosaminyltransferase